MHAVAPGANDALGFVRVAIDAYRETARSAGAVHVKMDVA